MMKIRLLGTPIDVEIARKVLEKNFRVLSCSGQSPEANESGDVEMHLDVKECEKKEQNNVKADSSFTKAGLLEYLGFRIETLEMNVEKYSEEKEFSAFCRESFEKEKAIRSILSAVEF